MLKWLLFNSLISVEQRVRWKYILILKFPLSFRVKEYIDKIEFLYKFLDIKIQNIVKLEGMVNKKREEEEDKPDKINYFWMVKDIYDLDLTIYVLIDSNFFYRYKDDKYFHKKWKEVLKLGENEKETDYLEKIYIYEWNFHKYYYDWKYDWRFRRIHKKVEEFSKWKVKYMKYFSVFLDNEDYGGSVKFLKIYKKIDITHVLGLNLFLHVKYNERSNFRQNWLNDFNFFNRWQFKDYLSNSVEHLSDPLVFYEWIGVFKLYVEDDLMKPKKYLENILNSKKNNMLKYILIEISEDKIENIVNLAFFVVLKLAVKKSIIKYNDLYEVINDVIIGNFNHLTNLGDWKYEDEWYWYYLNKKKEKLKLGKKIYVCIKDFVEKYFYVRKMYNNICFIIKE